MIGRKKQLKSKDDIPYLNAGETSDRVRSEPRSVKKTNRWYKIYLATTLSVVFLTVLFLFIGVSEEPYLEDYTFEHIASLLLSNDLMDLSGEERSEDDEGDKPQKDSIFDVISGILMPSGDKKDPPNDTTPDTPGTPLPPQSAETLYNFDYSKIPEGETAIIPMDLSLSENGSTYIHNSTGYSPDTKALLSASLSDNFSPEYISASNAPVVLILHTHATESYSKNGAISFLDTGGEIARSENTSENVVAVGAVMSKILNENGIPTLHCTVLHDSIQYKDSYSRAEETINQYLKKYPSIKLVIDLHRDAVIKSTGELVRPVTLIDGQPAAQVMCVVGSDWGGASCPSWQKNLSLALKLRDALNTKYQNLCRPAYLRPSTYNQELSPFSMLIEVGSCGNSLEEAIVSAKAVAAELIPLIKSM